MTMSAGRAATINAWSGPEPARARRPPRPWINLLLIVAGVLFFMYVIGPWGLQTDTLKPIADTIDEYNIEANAYYYSEVEVFSTAERYLYNSMYHTEEMK